ncbi:hypothetical protein H633G_03366 [Metarhizium anisopliae BRIP 53284]|nr:hypothetical protein H633G_03366 [Metarhizium anisopliae BRIP 53284]
MGKELLDEFPILAVAISKMDSVLDSVLAALSHPPSWTIAGALRQPKETSQIGAVTHSQPLCTTVQIGLVKLLSSWGINPRAVVGHSSGEMTAAFASGKITLAEAIIAAYHRRYAVGVLTHGGKYQSLVANAIPKLDVSPSMVSDATLYSSVTGYSHHGPFDAAYWRANLESPVLFVDALSELARGGKYTLIELGPHSALELPIKQTRAHLKLEEASLSYFAALRRGKDSVDKSKVNDPGFGKEWTPSVVANLPPYCWAYDSILWNEGRLSLEFYNREFESHELLGSKVPGGSDTDGNWRNLLLDDTVIVPGSAFLAMAMEAVSQTTGRSLSLGTGLEMRNVHIVAALTIPATANSSTELFTDLRKSPITNVSSSETWRDFKLTIYREGVPVLHATGTIAIHESAAAEAIEPRIRLSEAELEPSAKQIWYQRFGKGGLNYGPLFQSVNEIWVLRSSADKVVLGMVWLEQKSAVDGSAPARYPFHPITLEAMVQAGILATESRLRTYTASTNQGARGLARHPTLRVVWKPDVQGAELLREADLTKYLNHFLAEAHSPVGKDDGLIKLGAAISLISHRNTRLSIILELGAALALVA